MVTQAMLEREIAKTKKTKAEHSVEKAGQKRRRIGFCACDGKVAIKFEVGMTSRS